MKSGAYVYILTNRVRGTLYIGATTDLVARIYQHRTGAVKGFTEKYKLRRLVFCEMYDDLDGAFMRERQLKKWNRDWKVGLIERDNPNWDDLYPTIAIP
ncbi:MAG: GIY-YIG nuclease family protein [Rhodomicrobiaceae bacterium]